MYLDRYRLNRFEGITPQEVILFDKNLVLPTGVTFTRASSGTYFDSNGIMQTAAIDAARFEHDPATGRALGLLIEGSRTNFFTNSNSIGSSGWSVSRSELSLNSAIGPDGQNNASLWTEANVAGSSYIYRNLSISPGEYTLSVSCKQYNQQKIILQLPAGNGFPETKSIRFHPTTEGVEQLTAGAIARIQKLQNGFYAVSIGNTATTTYNGNVIFYTFGYNFDSSDYGLFIVNADLENGPYATSHILTTSTAVTRAADICTRSDSLSLEQTYMFSFQAPIAITSETRTLYQLDDGTSNNQIRFESVNGSFQCVVISGGIIQTTLVLGTLQQFQEYKVVFGIKGDDFSACLNGGPVITSATGALPTVTTGRLGHTHLSTNYWNGCIKGFAKWNRRLSNYEIQTLSKSWP